MANYTGRDYEGPDLYGNYPHDAENNDAADDFDEADCGLMNNGSCSMAGSEYCDFECPNRD